MLVGEVPREIKRAVRVAVGVVGGMAGADIVLGMMMVAAGSLRVVAAVRDRNAEDPPRSQSDQDLHHQQDDRDRLGER